MSTASGPSAITGGLILEFDAANPKSFSPNVHPSPLDIYAWAGPGGGYECTLSRDYTTSPSPAGGIPMLIATANPGTSAYTGSYYSTSWSFAPASAGQTWTVSFWVKGSGSFTGQGYIFGADSAGHYQNSDISGFSYAVTTSWNRVSYTYTMASSNTVGVQVRFDCYNNSVNMWVDGLQVERSSVATLFNPTTNTNGASLKDISSLNSNLTMNGYPLWTKLGGAQCFQFTATGQSFTGTLNGTQPTTDLTIESWIYPQAEVVSGDRGTILLISGAYNAYMSWNKGNQQMSNYWYGHPTEGYWETGAAVSRNSWNNFTCVWNNSAGVAYQWTNGVKTTTGSTVGNAATGANINIGQESTSRQFAGGIALIRVYSRALADLEVQQNFTALRGRYGI